MCAKIVNIMPSPNQPIDYRPQFWLLLEKLDALIDALNNKSLEANVTINMQGIDTDVLVNCMKEVGDSYKKVHGLE